MLVNNVGAGLRKPFLELTVEELDRLFALNFTSAAMLMQALHAELKPANGAAVVGVSSVAGIMGVRNTAVYGAMKAALSQLTRALAVEAGPRQDPRQRGRAVVHAHFARGGRAVLQPAIAGPIVARTPLGRVAEPHEIASVIAFLCLPQPSYVTGRELSVDGGMSVAGLM